MASRAVMADRVDYALRMLLKGHSCCRVVADLADKQGISRRQGRRIVNRAYDQLKRDLDEAKVDRVMVVSQTIHLLQEGAAKALEIGHISAMVGCLRELRELCEIAKSRSHQGHHHI